VSSNANSNREDDEFFSPGTADDKPKAPGSFTQSFMATGTPTGPASLLDPKTPASPTPFTAEFGNVNSLGSFPESGTDCVPARVSGASQQSASAGSGAFTTMFGSTRRLRSSLLNPKPRSRASSIVRPPTRQFQVRQDQANPERCLARLHQQHLRIRSPQLLLVRLERKHRILRSFSNLRLPQHHQRRRRRCRSLLYLLNLEQADSLNYSKTSRLSSRRSRSHHRHPSRRGRAALRGCSKAPRFQLSHLRRHRRPYRPLSRRQADLRNCSKVRFLPLDQRQPRRSLPENLHK